MDTLNEQLLAATMGKYKEEEHHHPLFREISEHAKMWGRFTLKDPLQPQDIENFLNSQSTTGKVVSPLSTGALPRNN